MNALPVPAKAHLEWQNRELGVLIHHDLEVYDNNYCAHRPDTLPSPEVFNPRELDTDQWLECCVAAGGRSAVLVVKHCSGFTLFPTAAHEFGVHSSPWRNGKGDVAADFVKSCEKYKVKPGFYFSLGCNDYLRACTHRMMPCATLSWEEYTRLVMIQLRELWSRYGELGEIWFDVGMWPERRDREKLAELVNELQSNAVCFAGDPSLVTSARHSGNEDGTTLEWGFSGYDNRPLDYLNNQRGLRDGRYFCPMECITTNRENDSFWQGWFYRQGEDHTLFRPEELIERYYRSVGHNSTLLIGMEIDHRGLVPDADSRQFAQFGRLLREQFSDCVGCCRDEPGVAVYEIANPDNREVNMLELMEDVSLGERIGRFKLFGLDENGDEVPLTFGDAVGHKLLERFPRARFRRFRLRILETFGEPQLLRFALYRVERY